jgi:Uma2 family endonuclease
VSTLLGKRFVTPEEYLEEEELAERKSEYRNGEVFLMAGTSSSHNLIVTNLVVELASQLRKRPCKVYSQDLRLRVSPTGLYTYPDVMVTCGDEQFLNGPRTSTLLNPILIVEVLSDSTRDYDRGEKFEHYRRLASLKEYLTVDQAKAHVDHWKFQEVGSWLLHEFHQPEDVIELEFAVTLRLADFYF